MLPLLLALALPAAAQEGEAPAPAYDALGDLALLDLETLELQAMELYSQNRLLSARKVADHILERDDSSVVGHFVAGVVWRESEGNHARAMRHLGRARQLLETQVGSWGGDGDLHRQILNAVWLTAQELEEYEYELSILDYYNSRYDPPLLAERAWPLMKLDRWDEARQAIQEGLAAHDPWQQSLGHNTLCALESLAGMRAAAQVACDAALAHGLAGGEQDITVDAYNASLAATAMLDFARAEELALQADTGVSLSTSNPHVLRVWLYLTQGRGQEAVAALTQMQAWRARQPPYLRDQARATAEAALALTLLVAGQGEVGLEVADRVMRFPDRLGMSSSAQAQTQGTNAVIRLALRRLARERHLEDAAARGWGALLWARLRGLWPDLEEWTDRATVRAAVTERELLVASLRPHLSGSGLILPSWLLPELVEVLGPGVVEAGARAAERLEMEEGFTGYYQALFAEVAWARGDEDEVLTLAQAALEGLPTAERLLRAQLTLRLAQAEEATLGEAVPRYAEAYALDPGVFRRLDAPLPAEVEVLGEGRVAARVGRALDRSPRLRDEEGAFRVTVEGAGLALRVCLRSPEGNTLRCADMPPPPLPEPPPEGEEPPPEPAEPAEPDPDERVAALVRAFHDEIFAMPLGLSRLDRGSLDGATTIAEEQVRQRMEGLLEQAAGVDPR